MLRHLLAAALAVGTTALAAEERRSIGGLRPHVAGAFDEIAACHLTPSGEYLVFDRRAHAVSTVAVGADVPKKIVQIGHETGRILRPTAFDSAPNGTFVVADSPGNQHRIQFFSDTGSDRGDSLCRAGTRRRSRWAISSSAASAR